MNEERKHDGCSSLFFGTSEGVARIDLPPERSATVNDELTKAANAASDTTSATAKTTNNILLFNDLPPQIFKFLICLIFT